VVLQGACWPIDGTDARLTAVEGADDLRLGVNLRVTLDRFIFAGADLSIERVRGGVVVIWNG
jgi:hypothetical protein